MDTTIKYSRGSNKYDNAPEQCEASNFDEFAERVLNDRSHSKGLAYITAPMAYGRHDNDGEYPDEKHYRLSSHALERRYLPLDLDWFANSMVFAGTLNFMQQFSAIIYTTASHTEESPRARVIIELSRNVSRAEGVTLGLAFQSMMRDAIGSDLIKFDETVYRAEQPCYTPVTSSLSWLFAGRPLEVDALLQSKPSCTGTDTILDWGEAPSWVNTKRLNLDGSERVVVEKGHTLNEVSEMLRFIDPACDRSTWRGVGFAIADAFGEAGRDLFIRWSAGELVQGVQK